MSGLKRYSWSFGIALIVFLILQFAFKSAVSTTNANYILSSITQGLASLVALLFVIIFFLCQSTGRVSMLSQVLKPDGYFLLGIFVISIIFPLIIMKIGYTKYLNILVNISISLATFCLFSLFPFINSVKQAMKNFGITHNLSKLPTLNIEYQHKLKAEEIIDDLLVFEPKEIVESTPDKIVHILVQILGGKIKDEFYTLSKRRAYMKMIAQIGSLSFIMTNKKEQQEKVQKFIFDTLNNNYYPTPTIREKSKELFRLSLFGISIILSNLKKHKKCTEDVRSLFAKSLTQTLLLIFSLLKNGKEGDKDVIENKKILEEKILIFIEKKQIYKKDYEMEVEGLIAAEGLEKLNISNEFGYKFKGYFKDLLNSNK